MSVDIYQFHKAQVFISYTKSDRPLVANFVNRLKDEAIAAAAVLWYDTHLTPAREWEDEIMTRLNGADIILVLASPEFFQSDFAIERELPVIQQRAKGTLKQSTSLPSERLLGRTPVRVIRLRAFDERRPEIEGLYIWPEGDSALESVRPDGPEISELRTWLKVEICKALVRRHADTYHHRSREEEIQRRNEDLDFDGRSDDLTFLHHELGVPLTTKARVTFGVVGAAAVGAAGGLAIKSWLLSGPMAGFLRPVIFFALLGFVYGLVKPGFRGIEMMLEAFRSRGPDKHFWTDLAGSLVFTPLVVLSGLMHMCLLGGILGLPVGAVLSIGGWSIDIGLVGAAAIGGVLCCIPGFDFAYSFTPKQLKVFTDVRHLYQPPVVEPIPSPVSSESY